jgi:glycosyltransferase involved in cell wall biosynthesis
MKTYGLDVAITAGLESAIGDVVVVCLPPFDPTDKIVEFINVARAGYIGLGQRPPGHYEGMWHSFAKKVFYVVVNRFLNFGLPSDTTYFVSLPRQAVTHIQRAKDRFRFLKVVTAQTGLPIQLLNYVPAEKDGRVYRTFWESILLSIDVVTSQSLTLLRFASLLSLFVSLGSLSYLIYAFNIFLFKSEVQKGWSSLSIFISACFFLLGLVFAILTEYLAKLFSESSNRPIYTIGNETVSDRVVANSHRANVLDTSKVD